MAVTDCFKLFQFVQTNFSAYHVRPLVLNRQCHNHKLFFTSTFSYIFSKYNRLQVCHCVKRTPNPCPDFQLWTPKWKLEKLGLEQQYIPLRNSKASCALWIHVNPSSVSSINGLAILPESWEFSCNISCYNLVKKIWVKKNRSIVTQYSPQEEKIALWWSLDVGSISMKWYFEDLHFINLKSQVVVISWFWISLLMMWIVEVFKSLTYVTC